jgi:hypothetical protein
MWDLMFSRRTYRCWSYEFYSLWTCRYIPSFWGTHSLHFQVWAVQPFPISSFPDDGGSTHLWNVGRQLFYTAVHPRRQFWTFYDLVLSAWASPKYFVGGRRYIILLWCFLYFQSVTNVMGSWGKLAVGSVCICVRKHFLSGRDKALEIPEMWQWQDSFWNILLATWRKHEYSGSWTRLMSLLRVRFRIWKIHLSTFLSGFWFVASQQSIFPMHVMCWNKAYFFHTRL